MNYAICQTSFMAFVKNIHTDKLNAKQCSLLNSYSWKSLQDRGFPTCLRYSFISPLHSNVCKSNTNSPNAPLLYKVPSDVNTTAQGQG